MTAMVSSWRARPDRVMPSPPAASGWSTRKVPCLSEEKATGLPRVAMRVRVAAVEATALSDGTNRRCISRPVASSTRTRSVQAGPRSSNQ
jgi:hypothetical protein